MLTSRMANLARDLEGSKVRLASFSLDPENDTPEELAIYAAKWHADEKNWSFLTGPIADVQRVVTAGFKVGVTRLGEKDGVPNIQHGNWFVLIDAAGVIRGYFRADEESDRRTLVEAARALELRIDRKLGCESRRKSQRQSQRHRQKHVFRTHVSPHCFLEGGMKTRSRPRVGRSGRHRQRNPTECQRLISAV